MAEHGAVVIDADQLAREVVEPGSQALAQIRQELGESLIRPDGQLDRSALGALIFSDSERRLTLNSIVHPAVQQLARARIAEAEATGPDAIIVYDVPLLAEATVPHRFDMIVVVHASTETKVKRLMHDRNMTRADAVNRISAQASDAERLALADVVIDSDGSLASTVQQADALWSRVSGLNRTEALPRHNGAEEQS